MSSTKLLRGPHFDYDPERYIISRDSLWDEKVKVFIPLASQGYELRQRPDGRMYGLSRSYKSETLTEDEVARARAYIVSRWEEGMAVPIVSLLTARPSKDIPRFSLHLSG